MRAIVSLAWARLRYRPARWLLVSLGVAAATMLPVVAANTAAVVAAQALRYGLEDLPPGERTVVVLLSGLREAPTTLAELDRQARHSLADLAAGGVRVQMLSRRIADGAGGSYYFSAADNLQSAIRITSGRAPEGCTPQRCEVVVIGTGTPRLDPALGIVIVGRAQRTDPLLLTGSFDPGPDAPLLVADGVAAAAQLKSLEVFQRTYAWVTTVDLGRVGSLGVDAYLARSVQVGIELYHYRLSLVAPDETLHAAADRAARSTRRFGLLGGAAMALLLGFAAIGAIGLRRDHAAAVALLRRRGAGRFGTGVATAVIAAVPVVLGTGLGVAAGAIVAAVRPVDPTGWPASAGYAAASAEEIASAVRPALLAAGPTLLAGVLAATAVVAATLAVGTGPPRPGRDPAGARVAWRAVDLTVVVGVLIAALALARGAVTASGLATRTDPLLLALPVIFVVCGGLLVGRAWPGLTAAAARMLPRRWVASQLGLLGAVRRPLRPVATVAFLAAATGVVAFAGAYQATLRQGVADQASFAIPLDASVRTGANLQRPLDVAGLGAYRATGPGVTVHPVLRTSAGVPVNASSTVTVEVIGVDPDALGRIRSWPAVVGAGSAAQARQLIQPAPLPRPGFAVPDGVRLIAMTAAGDAADLDLTAWLRDADGRDVGVPLRLDGDYLVGELPAPATASRLFALTVTESSFSATRRQHRIGEGGNDVPALTGRVELGRPRFAVSVSDLGLDSAAEDTWAGWGSGEAAVSTVDDELAVGYQLAGTKAVIRAEHDAAAAPMPVLTDAATAAAAPQGRLELSVSGADPLPARIVAVLPRFPTVGPSFVVADAGALADALDARDPGTGAVSELWLSAPPDRGEELARALAAAPFDRLRVQLRQAREDRLATDPLALGATSLLTGSALVALMVGVVALVLLVVAEHRDEAAQLYAWESDGVAPATLRRALFLRAVAVVGVGVPGGVLIGVALSRVTTALVRLTASGADPVPPLRLAVHPLWTATIVGAGLAIGLAACAGVTATALREPLPLRPDEELS